MDTQVPKTALAFYLDELLKEPGYTLASIAHAVSEPEGLIRSIRSGELFSHIALRHKLLQLYYQAYLANHRLQATTTNDDESAT